MRKESNKSLERYRFVFFMVGLVLASFVALTTLQWKFVNNSAEDRIITAPRISDAGVVPPRTTFVLPEPPRNQPDVSKDILEPNFTEPKIVVDNTWNLDDQDPNEGYDEIPKLGSDEELNDIPVSPFDMQRLPIFNGCEQYSGDDRELCMNQKLRERIQGELVFTEVDKYAANGTKVYVEFVVGVEGEVRDVVIHRSPTANIEMQLKEIMSRLPQFMPGLKDGKEQAVKLTLPVRLNTL